MRNTGCFPGGRKNMNYEMAGTTTEQRTGGISEQAAERLEQIGREILAYAGTSCISPCGFWMWR